MGEEFAGGFDVVFHGGVEEGDAAEEVLLIGAGAVFEEDTGDLVLVAQGGGVERGEADGGGFIGGVAAGEELGDDLGAALGGSGVELPGELGRLAIHREAMGVCANFHRGVG